MARPESAAPAGQLKDPTAYCGGYQPPKPETENLHNMNDCTTSIVRRAPLSKQGNIHVEIPKAERKKMATHSVGT
jgi:hypothetical protein